MLADDAFPGKYLSAKDLIDAQSGQSRRVRVRITNVTLEKVGDNRRLVLELARTDKKMVVNKTNMNTLADLTRSRETEDWIGWGITLYATRTQFQGNTLPALRISDDPSSSSAPPNYQPRNVRQAAPPRDARDSFDSQQPAPPQQDDMFDQRRDDRDARRSEPPREPAPDTRDRQPVGAAAAPPRDSRPALTDDDIPF